MKNSAFKTQITKVLKANGFKKSEMVKEWNHPKHKCAGFCYETLGNTYLGYYIAENIFSTKEREEKIEAKVSAMYHVLVANGFEKYLIKNPKCIIWTVDNMDEVLEVV